ncbi:MAG: capsule biosynthesis protein [Rhodospirillales bacterium]|nr:capsule biosynthesis protein [Rhodospirillales bacterium]
MPDASDLTTYARLLRLTPVEGAHPVLAQLEAVAERQEPPRRDLRALVRRYSLGGVLAFVLLPTLVATAYFGLIAADRFESEARFVIRTPGATSTNAAMASVMQSAGVTSATEEALIARDYLESRDAMTYLEEHAGLRDAVGNRTADFLWRYPNFFTSNTKEGLFWHYHRLLSVELDTTTGVTLLRIQGFDPQQAQRLVSNLLTAAETLINRLNERARNDAIAFAEAEVDRMRQRAVAAQAKLTAFREREALIDPSHATLAVLETIARLAHDVAQVNVQLRELQSGSPGGPQIGGLRVRQAALEAQIAAERQRLAGDSASIAPRIAEYEQLMLERGFAERALLAALTAVELARVEAQRQHVYVERVAAPSLPDHPAYPLRIVWCLAVLAISYAVFRIGKVLVDDARHHADP